MAHHSQYEQTAQIVAEVTGVMIALGHKEYHHRCRQPSNGVQAYLRQRLCLLVSLYAHPRQMINRHGNDGDDFQRIATQSFFRHYSNFNIYDVI